MTNQKICLKNFCNNIKAWSLSIFLSLFELCCYLYQWLTQLPVNIAPLCLFLYIHTSILFWSYSCRWSEYWTSVWQNVIQSAINMNGLSARPATRISNPSCFPQGSKHTAAPRAHSLNAHTHKLHTHILTCESAPACTWRHSGREMLSVRMVRCSRE